MNIEINFHETLLTRYKIGSGPLLFEITWNHDKIVYPMNNWSDFGKVILGWWVTAVSEIINGNDESEFYFMDGPYSISARYNREINLLYLSPKGIDSTWTISLNELIEQLINAFEKVSSELAQRGIGTQDQEYCKQCISALKEYLCTIR